MKTLPVLAACLLALLAFHAAPLAAPLESGSTQLAERKDKGKKGDKKGDKDKKGDRKGTKGEEAEEELWSAENPLEVLG